MHCLIKLNPYFELVSKYFSVVVNFSGLNASKVHAEMRGTCVRVCTALCSVPLSGQSSVSLSHGRIKDRYNSSL